MSDSPHPISPQRTLLVVDDQHGVCVSLSFLLSGVGYRVIAAESGRTAIALLDSELIDGAIIDVHMPGMNGFETCVALPPIVVVEENSDDWLFIERRIRTAGAQNPLTMFSDGDEALDYLAGLIARANSTLPRVMFTDLKLLGSDGFDVIARVRQHPELNQMKIFVLSGSSNPAHRSRAIQLGANGYLVKYPPADELAKILRSAGAATSETK